MSRENEKRKMLQSFKTEEESGYIALGQYIPVRRHIASNVVSSVNYTVPITLPEEPKFNIYEGNYSYISRKDKKEQHKQVLKSVVRVLKSLFFNFSFMKDGMLIRNNQAVIQKALSKTDSINQNADKFAEIF